MRLPESLLSRNICSVASDSRNLELDQQPAGAKTGGNGSDNDNPEQGLGRSPERSFNKAATTTKTTTAAATTRRN